VERRPDRLFRLEVGLAVASALLCLLTLLWKDWIEVVFRIDPDRGSGALEWLVALALLGVAIGFGALARRGRLRRPRAAD
jgi:hypothetical protein